MSDSTLTASLLSRRMLTTFFLGFSSGLPLLAIGGTFQAWMKDEGVDLALIGMSTLIGLPYTLKFLWAPAIDRWTLPFLGRRRGWMIATQIAVAISLILMSFSAPAQAPLFAVIMALLVSFCSASQDIVLDAHRRDTLHDAELGLGSSLFVNGYRVGMLVSGAFALYLAEFLSWQIVYLILAVSMAVGAVTTLAAEEPEVHGAPKNLRESVVLPLKDFLTRERAFLILAFVLLYKIGDSLASALTTPFFLELGFAKAEVAGVAKTVGLTAIITGGLAGGGAMLRLGLNRSLWLFGLIQSASIVSFAWLAVEGKDLSLLAFVVGFENFCAGMGTTAYAAYMASVCNRKYSATQYALLSSIMGVPRVLLSSPSGIIAKSLGWPGYFVFCALTAIPGMVLLLWLAPWNAKQSEPTNKG